MKTRLLYKELIRRFYQLSTLWLETGQHITRYSMYRRLGRYAKSWPEGSRALSISGSVDLAVLLGFAHDQIVDARYPEHNVFKLSFDDNTFDAVVSDQVLEHVEGNPQEAIDECFRVLKPGGLAVHTTCFINPIHRSPGDFWRFTPDALDLMVKSQSNVVESAGWGNRMVWVFEMLGMRWVRIPHSKLHPLHWFAVLNSSRWPVVTWVYCFKKQK